MKKVRLAVFLTAAVLVGSVVCVHGSESSSQAESVSGETVNNEDHSVLKNADDAPLNTIFQISADDHVENTPDGNGISSSAGQYTDMRSVTGYLNGTLTTTGREENNKYQIFVSTGTGTAEPSVMYYRYCKDGSWTRWHSISDQVSPSAANIAIRKKMIAPYLDADGNPTAENTGVNNPQYMVDDEYIFNDFNKAPLNSIYQIDRDCDSSVMANNPLPGRSEVLITTGFSYVSRHGIVQLCYALGRARTYMYYRYGYYETLDDYRWSDWEKVMTASSQELTLAAGTSEEVTVSASQLQAMIDELSEVYGAFTTGVLEIKPSGFEQGSWGYSSKTDQATRLRSATSYKITSGTKVVFTNPSLKIYLGLLQTPSSGYYVQWSDWIDPGEQEAEYTFWDDGYLNIILESPDGTEITPADYDCSIKIIYH